jgi:uncharacterized protein (DUF58 family)
MPRPVPEGIRITKVGLWFVLFTVLVAVAATNTGNNALYLVLASMLGLLVVSGITSRHNLRGLGVAVDLPGEVFANQPFHLPFSLRNKSRFLPRWLLHFAVQRNGSPRLLTYLPPLGFGKGRVDRLGARRGFHRLVA